MTAVRLDAGDAAHPHPAALEAARQVLADAEGSGFGAAAEAALALAGSRIAARIGAEPPLVRLVPGGAAAVWLAVRALAGRDLAGPAGGGRLVCTALEPPSVAAAARQLGLEVIEVEVDPTGRVDVDRWAAAVAGPGVVAASLSHAAWAIGSMHHLAECAGLAHERGVPVHADASATVGALPVDAGALGVDALTFAGPAAFGLPGCAALYLGPGFEPGGPFEPREPVEPGGPFAGGPPPDLEVDPVAAAALGAAAEAVGAEVGELAACLWPLSDRLRHGLSGAGLTVLGHPTQRVPHVVAVALAGSGGGRDPLEALLEAGVRASAVDPAPLARAGLVEPGSTVVRFGLHRASTAEDVERAVAATAGIARSSGG